MAMSISGKRADPFADLARELQLLVASFCPWTDLLTLRLVNKHCLGLVHDALPTHPSWYTAAGNKVGLLPKKDEPTASSILRENLPPDALDPDTEAHRILTFLRIPSPEQSAMPTLPLMELCALDRFYDVFSSLKLVDGGDGENARIPFANTSLFSPPRKGVVPCHVRYVVQGSCQKLNDKTHRENDEVNDIVFLIRGAEGGARGGEGEGEGEGAGYITVRDFCLCFGKNLEVMFRWEERITVESIKPYVQSDGQLHVTLTLSYDRVSPSDLETYKPPASFYSIERTSDRHASDSDTDEEEDPAAVEDDWGRSPGQGPTDLCFLVPRNVNGESTPPVYSEASWWRDEDGDDLQLRVYNDGVGPGMPPVKGFWG